MLLGMVAFSVLTANFTSSLNHEIEKDLNLFGKKVSSSSMQFKALFIFFLRNLYFVDSVQIWLYGLVEHSISSAT